MMKKTGFLIILLVCLSLLSEKQTVNVFASENVQTNKEINVSDETSSKIKENEMDLYQKVDSKILLIEERYYKPYPDATYSLKYYKYPTSVKIAGVDNTDNCSGDLVIPSTIDGFPVTTIWDLAFNECSGFTGSLIIPDSVTEIASGAFDGCSGFTGSLTIPDSVTNIGNGAFEGCSGFTGSLTIPDSVTEIGDYAFYGCSGFTGSLTIPDSVTSIGDTTFRACSGFTGSLTIPDSVTSIGDSAFYECSGFTGSLTIPDSVTEIGGGAFKGCSGFTGSLTIPDSVTNIGYRVFDGCSGFTGSLTIPDSVTEIGDYAFYGCSGFTGNLTIPDSVTEIGGVAFEGCSGFTGSLTISNSATEIGDGAFKGCSGFTGSLTIPDSVTSIGELAFGGCSGFTGNLTISNSVTMIDQWAFEGCSGFTGSLAIPDSVTNIGYRAFWGCSGFTGSLTIPDSVTNIGGSVFYGCSGFNKIINNSSGYISLPLSDDQIWVNEAGKEISYIIEGIAILKNGSNNNENKDTDFDTSEVSLTLIPGEVKRLSVNSNEKYMYGIKWTITEANPQNCVSIKNGVITAKDLKKGINSGKATITAILGNLTKTFNITVDGTNYDNTEIQDGKTKFKITAKKTISTTVGTNKQISVNIPKQLRAADKEITYTVLTDGVCEVGEAKYDKEDRTKASKVTFEIIPKDCGATYIIWNMNDDKGNTTQACTKVIVKKPITELTTDSSELTLTVGEGKRIGVVSTTGNTDNSPLSFSASGKGIKVSKSGYVVATTPGVKGMVTIKSGKVKTTVKVTTTDYTGEYLTLNKSSVNVKIPKAGAKDKTVSLKLATPKKNAKQLAVEWNILNSPTGIKVENGIVYINSSALPGCYIITATSEGFNTAYCEIILK